MIDEASNQFSNPAHTGSLTGYLNPYSQIMLMISSQDFPLARSIYEKSSDFRAQRPNA